MASKFKYAPKPAGHSGGKRLRSPDAAKKVSGAKMLSTSGVSRGIPKKVGKAPAIAALQAGGAASKPVRKGASRPMTTIGVLQDPNRVIRPKQGKVAPAQAKGGKPIRAIKGPSRVRGQSASGVQGAK